MMVKNTEATNMYNTEGEEEENILIFHPSTYILRGQIHSKGRLWVLTLTEKGFLTNEYDEETPFAYEDALLNSYNNLPGMWLLNLEDITCTLSTSGSFNFVPYHYIKLVKN